jgi:hypothetical protein
MALNSLSSHESQREYSNHPRTAELRLVRIAVSSLELRNWLHLDNEVWIWK